jgi:hypothetical protein
MTSARRHAVPFDEPKVAQLVMGTRVIRAARAASERLLSSIFVLPCSLLHGRKHRFDLIRSPDDVVLKD